MGERVKSKGPHQKRYQASSSNNTEDSCLDLQEKEVFHPPNNLQDHHQSVQDFWNSRFPVTKGNVRTVATPSKGSQNAKRGSAANYNYNGYGQSSRQDHSQNHQNQSSSSREKRNEFGVGNNSRSSHHQNHNNHHKLDTSTSSGGGGRRMRRNSFSSGGTGDPNKSNQLIEMIMRNAPDTEMIKQDEIIRSGVLKRFDEHFVKTITYASHTSVYEYQNNEWIYTDVVGSLTLYERDVEPKHAYIILNRNSITNYEGFITQECEVQMKLPYLMLRQSDGIRIFWFYHEIECLQMASALQGKEFSLRFTQDSQNEFNLRSINKEDSRIIENRSNKENPKNDVRNGSQFKVPDIKVPGADILTLLTNGNSRFYENKNSDKGSSEGSKSRVHCPMPVKPSSNNSQASPSKKNISGNKQEASIMQTVEQLENSLSPNYDPAIVNIPKKQISLPTTTTEISSKIESINLHDNDDPFASLINITPISKLKEPTVVVEDTLSSNNKALQQARPQLTSTSSCSASGTTPNNPFDVFYQSTSAFEDQRPFSNLAVGDEIQTIEDLHMKKLEDVETDVILRLSQKYQTGDFVLVPRLHPYSTEPELTWIISPQYNQRMDKLEAEAEGIKSSSYPTNNNNGFNGSPYSGTKSKSSAGGGGPLTRDQLVESFNYLLKNDASFIDQLHHVYTNHIAGQNSQF